MTSLLTRLAQAKGPDDPQLLEDVCIALGWTFAYPRWTNPEGYSPPGRNPLPNYLASLDAVLGLLPEGWFWRVGHSTLYAGWAHLNRKHPNHCDVGDEFSANAATPAIALLIAILRARGIE